MRISTRQLAKFWSCVNKTAENGCWEWTGRLSDTGYGQIDIYHIGKASHRVSWEIHNSTIPEGLFVCHHCDNPKCVNPEHLFIGTAKDNTDDMCRKGRHGRHGRNSKFSEEQISEIIELHKKGLSQSEIAKVFNVIKQDIAYQIQVNGLGKSKFTDEQKLQMKMLYSNGMYLKDIAKQFACGVSTVSKLINSISNKERTGV